MNLMTYQPAKTSARELVGRPLCWVNATKDAATEAVYAARYLRENPHCGGVLVQDIDLIATKRPDGGPLPKDKYVEIVDRMLMRGVREWLDEFRTAWPMPISLGFPPVCTNMETLPNGHCPTDPPMTLDERIRLVGWKRPKPATEAYDILQRRAAIVVQKSLNYYNSMVTANLGSAAFSRTFRDSNGHLIAQLPPNSGLLNAPYLYATDMPGTGRWTPDAVVDWNIEMFKRTRRPRMPVFASPCYGGEGPDTRLAGVEPREFRFADNRVRTFWVKRREDWERPMRRLHEEVCTIMRQDKQTLAVLWCNDGTVFGPAMETWAADLLGEVWGSEVVR
jgi:hypothetical protein